MLPELEFRAAFVRRAGVLLAACTAGNPPADAAEDWLAVITK